MNSFEKYIRKIKNVLKLKKTLINRLTLRKILNISRFNFVFVNFLQKKSL